MDSFEKWIIAILLLVVFWTLGMMTAVMIHGAMLSS